MATTQPIKNKLDIEAMKDYFLNEKKNLRNYALFCTGINTALRISDILSLRWKDVYDFEQDRFREHLEVKERKTGKVNTVALNRNITDALNLFKVSLSAIRPESYIFYGRNADRHLSRSQAYRIIKQASKELHMEGNISCHSLRKTFGYHALQAGANPVILMVVFNHSTFNMTKRYLGIYQDEKDDLFLKMNL